MTQYDHTENKRLYCEDWIETDSPWERWECSGYRGKWEEFDSHPLWRKNIEYRRIDPYRELKEAAKDAVIAKLRQELFCAGVEPINYNDDSALQEMLKQAKREGQAEMRERQVSLLRKNAHTFARNLVDEARALPIDGELVGSKGENE